MGRRLLALAVGGALLAALVAWGWPAIDRFVLHRKIYVIQPERRSGQDGILVGYAHVSRISGKPDGPQIAWYVRTGMIAVEAELDGGHYRITQWHPDGRVREQGEGPYGNTPTIARSPPWHWGVADQTAPSAPWLEAGLTPKEWWDSVEPRSGPADLVDLLE